MTNRKIGSTQIASRDEQHGRYLDCGPLAWDDRDPGEQQDDWQQEALDDAAEENGD